MSTNSKSREIARILKGIFDEKKSEERFVPGKTFIHYAGDVIGYEEVASVIDSLLAGRLAAGGNVDTFEKMLSEYLKVRHVATVNSGSTADYLAFLGLKNPSLKAPLKPGDEVITCALSFSTAVSSITLNGLTPVFVDTNLGTYTMDSEHVRDAIGKRTKAILAVHLFGNPCNMDEIMRIAREHDLFVIEDCCDALGSSIRDKQVGTFGDMGTFSFYPAHQITLMEGGAISTNDQQLDYIIRSLRMWGKALPCPLCGLNLSKSCSINHNQNLDGIRDYDFNYLFLNIGHNVRITEAQGAFGIQQLLRLDGFVEARKMNFDYIVRSLTPYEELLVLPRSERNSSPSWYCVPLTIQPQAGFSRMELAEFLRESRIEFRYLFTGNILGQPAFRHIKRRIHGNLRNADLTSTNSLFLGCYPGITDKMREYVCERLAFFLDKKMNRNRSPSHSRRRLTARRISPVQVP